MNEHHHLLVKLWGINTIELKSDVKERCHPDVPVYFGECFRLLSGGKKVQSRKYNLGHLYENKKGSLCMGV